MEKKFDIKYNIFNGLIEKYGKEAQVRQTFEEMAELTKELNKNLRGCDNKSNIIEEMADVSIMLQQVQLMFDISDEQLNAAIADKIIKASKNL